MTNRRQFTLRCAALSAAAMGVSRHALAAAEYTMRISHQFPPGHQTARNLDFHRQGLRGGRPE